MTAPDPGGPADPVDPVERNRSTPRRRVAGREDLGHPTTVRLLLVTVAVVVAATVILAAVVLGTAG